jgi:uncharacterized protein YcfL
MKGTFKTIFSLAILLYTIGCAHLQPTDKNKAPYCVLILDQKLAQSIDIKSQTVEHPDDIVIVRTILQNNSNHPIQFLAQTLFKDNNNNTLDISPHKLIRLTPYTTTDYAAHSTNLKTQRYVVYIRALE